MKQTNRIFRIIAIIAVIGIATACSGKKTEAQEGGVNPRQVQALQNSFAAVGKAVSPFNSEALTKAQKSLSETVKKTNPESFVASLNGLFDSQALG